MKTEKIREKSKKETRKGPDLQPVHCRLRLRGTRRAVIGWMMNESEPRLSILNKNPVKPSKTH